MLRAILEHFKSLNNDIEMPEDLKPARNVADVVLTWLKLRKFPPKYTRYVFLDLTFINHKDEILG